MTLEEMVDFVMETRHTPTGEWRVEENHIAGRLVCTVYRLRDVTAPDSDENRQYATGALPTREEAEQIARMMNRIAGKTSRMEENKK